MLQIEYQLDENDFMEFQLFAASQSPLIAKKKRRSWLLLSLASTALTINFIINQGNFLAVYFGVVSASIIMFYPRYINWQYKRHFRKHIRENYVNRFGTIEYLEFHDDHLFVRDKIGEGTINVSEVECVDETPNHFFLKVSTGMSIIIPKNGLSNLDEIREEFQRLGIVINNHLDWKS